MLTSDKAFERLRNEPRFRKLLLAIAARRGGASGSSAGMTATRRSRLNADGADSGSR
jgi:hypothetical protein